MATNGIESLPVELLTTILQLVRSSCRSNLLLALRCCRQWHELGAPILYKHVHLKVQSAKSMSAQVLQLSKSEHGRQCLLAIRSFRVMVPGDGRDYSGSRSRFVDYNSTEKTNPTEVLRPGIEALIEILPFLTNLCTFSIMAYGGTRMNGEDPYLGSVYTASRSPGPNQNIFSALLTALPPSVRDLSIDLSELSRVEPSEQCKICPAVNMIAPTLQHLNLHLRTYCPTLLSLQEPFEEAPDSDMVKDVDTPTNFNPLQPTSLQSIIVRMHGFRVKQCCYPFPSWPNPRWLAFDLRGFTYRMKQLCENGTYPLLKQFLIISKRRPPLLRQHDDCKWSVYVREIVTNKTAAFPRIFLEQHKAPPPGNSFTYAPRATIRVPDHCSFVDERHWGQEYVGGCGSIRRLVEGSAGWTVFSQGPHLPGLRRKERMSAAEEGYFFKTRGPDEACAFRNHCEVTCALWQEEEKSGQNLLQARVWDGVLDDQLLQRKEIDAVQD